MRAVVICLPELTAEGAAEVQDLRVRFPLLPLFVVSKMSTASIEAAYRIVRNVCVVWEDEVAALERLVREGLAKRPQEALHNSLASRPLTPALKEVLRLICVDPAGPSTVQGLAARVRISPATLRRQWREHLSRACMPGDLIDWVILLRWVELAQHTKLADAVYVLRVSERTVERIAKRSVDLTASAAARKRAVVHAAFSEWVKATF